MFNLFGLLKKKEAKKKVEQLPRPKPLYNEDYGSSFSRPTRPARPNQNRDIYGSNNSDIGYNHGIFSSQDWGSNTNDNYTPSNDTDSSTNGYGSFGGGDFGGSGAGSDWSSSSDSSSSNDSSSSDSGSSDCGSSNSD